MDMQTPQPSDRRYLSEEYRIRPRRPRFGILILVILAILSLIMAMVVAYILY